MEWIINGMHFICVSFFMNWNLVAVCVCVENLDWYAFLYLSNKAIGNSFTRHFEPSEYCVSWIQPPPSWNWSVVEAVDRTPYGTIKILRLESISHFSFTVISQVIEMIKYGYADMFSWQFYGEYNQYLLPVCRRQRLPLNSSLLVTFAVLGLTGWVEYLLLKVSLSTLPC